MEDRKALLRRAIRGITIDGQQMISSVTFSGGFLGSFQEHIDGAKLHPGTTTTTEFSATPDLTIQFPQPVVIKHACLRKRAA
jgi:hypothetical protein